MSDEIFDKDSEQDESTAPAEKNSEEISENSGENENKSTISSDLIRGHINTIILRALYDRDKYGYEIINEIEAKSHGQYTLKQPTLYSALKRLESQGYIKAYWKTDEVSSGGRRKYFTLTENGREITEKNQAEWEYSRTIIDNLISDRSFDFNQPAPTPVDFRILKSSVSRVPVVGTDSHEYTHTVSSETKAETPDSSAVTGLNAITEHAADASSTAQLTAQSGIQPTYQGATGAVNEKTENVQAAPAADGYGTIAADSEAIRQAEACRIAHENYIRLISQPAEPPIRSSGDENIVPNSEAIDTEKLIYNNKPETERDYKNLIDGIFNRATRNAQPKHEQSAYAERAYVKPDDNFTAASEKAKADGLKINTSERYEARPKNAVKTTYNLGSTLFKCSAVVGFILLIEFILCLVFKQNLNVGIIYPLVILAIAVAQFVIFGGLALSGYGRGASKPTTHTYLSVSIIMSIICILIICVVSFLLKVNVYSASDLMSKLIIPCIIALNIPVFAVTFYCLSK